MKGGEQPLPHYGCCDLGPIILTRFVKNPFKVNANFDFTSFATAVKTQVRFLDNVLDATMWPLEKQAKESSNKRRIGVGFTGLANALAMLNVVYYNDDGLALAQLIAKSMRNSAYEASIELAKEKGIFPLLDKEKYLEEGTFASRLPDSIKGDIRKYGIRNSHLLSIAPVGTISLAFADNASNGIEPPFSLAYTRKKRMSDGTSQMYPVIDHALRVWLNTNDESKLFNEKILEAICAYKNTFEIDGKEYNVKQSLPSSMVTALEMTPDQHLLMMKTVQPYIDSSISKTINCPVDITFDAFKHIYDDAWKYKLKGVSTYRPNDILGSVLSIDTPKKEEPVIIPKVIDIDPYSIQIKRSAAELEAKIKQVKYSDGNGDHTLYIGIAFDDVKGTLNGKDICVKRPFEFFINSASSSVPIEWITAYTRTHSLLARSGLTFLAKALQDNQTIRSNNGRIRYDWYVKEDGTKVPRYHGSDVAIVSYAIQKTLISYGILDELGNIIPLSKLNIKTKVEEITPTLEVKQVEVSTNRQPGKLCPECGDNAVIKRDSCSYCTNCGYVGNCG